MVEAATRAAKVKEQHVRSVNGRKGETDLLTKIDAFRGNELVASAFAPPNRDKMLHLCSIMSRGLGADVMTMTYETWSTKHAAKHPLTGEQWKAGDLQDLAENHDGLAKGYVHECLMTSGVNRAGDHDAISRQYVIEKRKVNWLSGLDLDSHLGGEMSGLVPDMLTKIMAEPPADVTLLQQFPGIAENLISNPNWRDHADIATVKAIMTLIEDCAITIGSEPDTERARLIREYLPEGEIIRP